MKNKKNAFTLVELLSVIVILAIILVIAVPKVMSIITDSKKATFEANARQILQYAENQYLENKTLGINEEIKCNDIAKINNEDYEICKIEFINDVARLIIKGSGKFDGLYICKNKKNTVEAVSECNIDKTSIELTIQKNDGTEDIIETYEEGTVIDLETLTREGYIFEGWEVVKGDSTITDNKLTVGSEDTIVYAKWKRNTLVTIDYDNGEENYSNRHVTNTTIDLEIPTKEGYAFSHWELISGLESGVLSGNNFTVGNVDAEIKAIYTPIEYTISYNLDGGSANNRETYTIETETFTLNNPSKTGYTFTGWAGSNGETPSTNVTIEKGTTGNKEYTANYSANTYTLTYNSGNLIYGMEDVDNFDNAYMTYSVSNKVVTVTAKQDDGRGLINGRVYLEAGKEYIFNCDTSGIWGYSANGDTVEALLLLNGGYDLYYNMENNKNYKFTPTQSGVYHLRLDVNQNGKTHTFSNISVSTNEKVETVTYGSTIELQDATREGYTFTGWSISGTGASMSGANLIIGAGNVILTAKWEPILVEQIVISETSIHMGVTDIINVETNVLPISAANKTLSWKTSDESVVSVDNGKLSANGEGEATITVSSTDGSNISKTINISVKDYRLSAITTSTNTCKNKGNVCGRGTGLSIKVSDSKTYTFYVIEDSGDEVIMIMSSDLVSQVKWYSGGYNNSYGPVTALTSLNNATTGWTNIRPIQDYTYINNLNGTAKSYGYQKLEIIDGVATLTDKTGNTKNTISGTSRTRLITNEEIGKIGCGTGDYTCPSWMYGGLSYGSNYMEHWSLSGWSTSNSVIAVHYEGRIVAIDGSTTRTGIRPVITIKK